MLYSEQPMDDARVNGPAAKILCAHAGFPNVSRIAAEIDVNRSHLSSVFSGKREGGVDLAIKLQRLTGYPAHYFLGPPNARKALIEAARAQGITPEDLEGAA